MVGQIQYLTDLQQFLNITDNFPCVAKLTAPAWCPPCKMLAPKYEELAEKYGGSIIFIVVDTDKAAGIARHCQCRSVPIVFFYNRGVRMDDLTTRGYDPEGLEDNIETFLTRIDSNLSVSGPIPASTNHNLQYLAQDNIVESSDDSTEEISQEPISVTSDDDQDQDQDQDQVSPSSSDHDEDSAHHEYGQDCEVPIEKTVDESLLE